MTGLRESSALLSSGCNLSPILTAVVKSLAFKAHVTANHVTRRVETPAERGILLSDELPEFNRKTLEVIRKPTEDAVVTNSSALLSTTFPAAFMLVAAANPCPVVTALTRDAVAFARHNRLDNTWARFPDRAVQPSEVGIIGIRWGSVASSVILSSRAS